MQQASSVAVVKAMLDSLDVGKVMLLGSHKREERVCMMPPLFEFPSIQSLFIWEVAMNPDKSFECSVSR